MSYLPWPVGHTKVFIYYSLRCQPSKNATMSRKTYFQDNTPRTHFDELSSRERIRRVAERVFARLRREERMSPEQIDHVTKHTLALLKENRQLNRGNPPQLCQ